MTGGGARYKVVVLPESRYLPLETSRARRRRSPNKAPTCVAFGGLASDVSGLADLPRRRDQFRRLLAGLAFGSPDARGVARARVGRGSILRGDDLEALLSESGIARESLVDRGLEFARRQSAQGRFYFVSNSSSADINGWVPLDGTAGQVVVHDPMRGSVAAAPIRSTTRCRPRGAPRSAGW